MEKSKHQRNPLLWNIIDTKNKWDDDATKVATFNCMGINEPGKMNQLETWAEKNNIKIMAIQETRQPYSSEEGGRAKINPEGVTRGKDISGSSGRVPNRRT